MPSPDHLAVIAAAGSRKTEFIVEQALARTDKRILLTTYTTQNLACIEDRFYSKVGRVPDNVTIMSWYSFLASQWCRPYQRVLFGEPGYIHGVDFASERSRYIPATDTKRYYANKNGELYRDWVADFAVKTNERTDGAVVRRLEGIYDEVYIDEVQDLVGYDLDALDFLLKSSMRILVVGDPRQHTYATNQGPRNRKYRGAGLLNWIAERSDICTLETRDVSYRSNQAICNFADELFPGMPATKSANTHSTTPTGVMTLSPEEARAHIKAHAPAVLRHNAASNTLGLPAMNFGASKGQTFDHVVIFPTKAIRAYLKDKDTSKLANQTRSKLYVAVTRARFSVVFVI